MKELDYDKKIKLSADIFAIAAVGTADESLGQNLEKLSKVVDYLSPMVYPSHYAQGQQIGGLVFSKPDLEPYGVVYQTLLSARKRLDKIEHRAKIRPYLQAFTDKRPGPGNYQK